MSTDYHGIHPDDDPELFGADEPGDPSPETQKVVIDAQIPLPGDSPSHEYNYLGLRQMD